MPPRESVRYNAEVERTDKDPSSHNYLTLAAVKRLVDGLREGDALVINAVAGPSADEI